MHLRNFVYDVSNRLLFVDRKETMQNLRDSLAIKKQNFVKLTCTNFLMFIWYMESFLTLNSQPFLVKVALL
jgi:hypothetical protein